MSLINLILLGVVIASNNLSFSFALGALETKKYHLRIVSVFTIVEFIIPLVGIYIGQLVSGFIENYAQITGSIILILFGIYNIYNAFKEEKETKDFLQKITSVKGLIIIALGLSLDNLLIGFSLGLSKVNPLTLASFIAFFSMTFSFIGLKTGQYIKSKVGRYVQIFAGLVLLIIGLINSGILG